jgi:hypothetical protein
MGAGTQIELRPPRRFNSPAYRSPLTANA